MSPDQTCPTGSKAGQRSGEGGIDLLRLAGSANGRIAELWGISPLQWR
jgi:hypothetical protein